MLKKNLLNHKTFLATCYKERNLFWNIYRHEKWIMNFTIFERHCSSGKFANYILIEKTTKIWKVSFIFKSWDSFMILGNDFSSCLWFSSNETKIKNVNKIQPGFFELQNLQLFLAFLFSFFFRHPSTDRCIYTRFNLGIHTASLFEAAGVNTAVLE